MLTFVSADASALVLAADELEDELDDDEDAGEDVSPDEQPDRLAMTIAAPPTATSKPCFTTVLHSSHATHQDQRAVHSSMGRRAPADVGLRQIPRVRVWGMINTRRRS